MDANSMESGVLFPITKNSSSFVEVCDTLIRKVEKNPENSDLLVSILHACLNGYAHINKKNRHLLIQLYNLLWEKLDSKKFMKTLFEFLSKFDLKTQYWGLTLDDLKVLNSWINHFVQNYTIDSPETMKNLAITQLELANQLLYVSYNLDKSPVSKEAYLEITKSVNSSPVYKDIKPGTVQVPTYLLLIAILSQLNVSETQIREIVKIYTDEVLLSKNHKTMSDWVYAFEFFNRKVVSNYFQTEEIKTLLPDLEKSILRSTEFIITKVLPDFLHCLLSTSKESLKIIVFNGTSFTKLFTQLFSSMKSSNADVRVDSLKCLSTIISRISPSLDVNENTKIVDDLAKSWKATSNPEQKIGFIKLLKSVDYSPEISSKIVSVLSPFVAKDQNELLHLEFLDAYFYWLFKLPSLDDSSILKQVQNGLSESKLPVRRLWFLALGANFAENLVENSPVISFLNQLISEFSKNIDQFVDSPLKFPTVIGCIVEILSKKLQLELNIEAVHILLSPKHYLKFSTDVERKWFVDLVYELIGSPSGSNIDDLDTAFFYINTTSSFDSDSKIYALQKFHKTYKSYSDEQKLKLVSFFASSVDKYLPNLNGDETKKFNFDLKLVKSIMSFFAHCPAFEKSIQSQISIKLLVVSHYNPIRSKISWVDLVLKSKSDPGAIVLEHGVEYFGILSQKLTDLNISEYNNEFEATISDIISYYNAIVDSIATLAFIQPDIIGPLIKDLIKIDLSSCELSSKQVEVWKTPADKLVDDPLNATKTSKYEVNKNSKDYETRKWEEEVKKEIQAKKAANGSASRGKLTKEQLELLKQQAEKEAKIRADVQSVFVKSIRSIYLIKSLTGALISKIDNGYKYWFADAKDCLLDFLKDHNGTSFIEDEAIDAFLNCTNILVVNNDAKSVESFKNSLGVLILKSLGIEHEKLFMGKEMEAAQADILYLINYISDRKPLDSFGLTFILSFLCQIIDSKAEILQKNGPKATNQEFVEADPDETAFLLAIDILSHHSEVFSDDYIPRTKFLNSLIHSMEKVTSLYKQIRECFNAICASVAENISSHDLKSVMLSNLMSTNKNVRLTILEQLDEEFLLDYEELVPEDYAEIWVLRHDNEEHIALLAQSVWEESGLDLTKELTLRLLTLLGDEDHGLRISVSRAVAEAVTELEDPELFQEIFHELISLFETYSKPPPPILDEFGLVIKTSEQQKDHWEYRNGIALTFKELAPIFTAEASLTFFHKLILSDDVQFLADSNSEVHAELQSTGVEIIKHHGLELVKDLVSMFEECDSKTDIASKIRQSVVIFYGVLCEHLDATRDNKLITQIINQLIKTLIDPTTLEIVQFTISRYLAPLVPLFKDKLSDYFTVLFDSLYNSSFKATQRRGAAYGIAGLVKGYGIKALSDFDIIRNLSEAAEDKEDSKKRQSVCFAFECLSRMLGKYFEPYVIEIIPLLLKSLGDHVQEVRSAADKTSQIIMKNTTSFGIKKLIPLALENLDEISWRSKKGSVELLGSMAYLDPTQLSASLSTIIPEIVGVLNDTHKEVRKAADQAMKKFGLVIRNPEIQKSVPILIKAIGDPTHYTEDALNALIKTQFVHYIDGPSLALIIHVLHRGMIDRSATTKRKSCQIVGNMSILVDSRDLVPYLPTLVSELEIAMVDPVAVTRATAARALGSLVEKLGEEHFPDLIGKLLATLGDETKAGDRMGSAQALAEVLSGLGVSRMEEVLPAILAGANSSKVAVKKGYMPMLFYLPVCFGPQFSPYISKVIGPILSGLASDDDTVSDAAVRAGKLIVSNYSNKAVDLLLPELEKGVTNSNYKIRLSSVRLIGDLLFKLGDITKKSVDIVDNEDDLADIESLARQQEQETAEEIIIGGSGAYTKLLEVLGQEVRDRVLSVLFICRSDVAGAVRAAAIEIWNPIVANTPKTIKEILPTLARIIIRHLGSPSEDQRRISALALGDVVRRIGPIVLNQLLPTSEEIMISGDSNAREGICVALKEIMQSTSESNIRQHQDTFIKIVADAIIDSDDKVREAAAQTFDALLECVGSAAIDGVVPRLLALLGKDENAIEALRELMANKSEDIFPVLIPSLLSPPLDVSKATTLGSLSEVAGPILYRYLNGIIEVFLNALVGLDASNELRKTISQNFTKFLLSIDDSEGCHPFMQKILSLLKNEVKDRRAIIFEHMSYFVKSTTLDYSTYVVDLLERCVTGLDSDDKNLVVQSWTCLNELVKHQSKEQLEKLVEPAESALRAVGAPNEDLPGFTIIPKGPGCLLPIFTQGLMYGSPNEKEISAIAIADVVSKTPAAGLKPFFTSITGPLIRVVGERVSSDVKAAILQALDVLLKKIPQFLRPFTPQLQRTFVRSLSDTSSEILRSRAVKALGTLILYQSKIDPLVTELINGVSNNDDSGVRTAMLKALVEIVEKVGKKLSEASKSGILELTEQEISEVDDKQAVAYAKLIGSISITLKTEEATNIIKNKILENENTTFSILTLNAFLKDSPNTVFESGLVSSIVKFTCSQIASTTPYLSDQSIMAAGKILSLLGETQAPQRFSVNTKKSEPFQMEANLVHELIEEISMAAVKPKSNSQDTRRLALVVLKTVARNKYEQVFTPENFDIVVPIVFSCVREIIIPVKLTAEKTFLELLKLVEDEKMELFTKWFEHIKSTSGDGKTIKTFAGSVVQLRALEEYTKRIGSRLAKVERERVEAGGDAETMFSDRFEDEAEIWSVGGN